MDTDIGLVGLFVLCSVAVCSAGVRVVDVRTGAALKSGEYRVVESREGERRAVTVSLEGLDRGVIVYVTEPVAGRDLMWSNSLSSSSRVKDGVLYGSNLAPISAVWSGDGKVALGAAIPPTHPVMFDTYLRDGEFGVAAYVGLTGKRAEVKAVFYPIDAKWGFRSALEKYYAAYPEFYSVRAKKAGLWCFNMDAGNDSLGGDCTFYEAGGAEWKGEGPRGSTEGSRDKGYGVSVAKSFREWAQMNDVPAAVKAGQLVFPYTIAGQRQIFHLPKPVDEDDYEGAMATFRKWTERPIPFQCPITANSFDSVDELKAIILNSGLQDAHGRYVLMPRLYTGNTLTFPLNPNPALFRAENRPTIAKYSLDRYVAGMLDSVPEIGGIYVDSLGRWCNFLNYRRDHMAAAKYPAGVDAEGRPVLRNLSSHYEYLEELGRRLHARGKLLFCNGVNEGGSKAASAEKKPYDAARPASRFFLAALSDVAGTESGARTSVARMESARILMGPKPYATLGKTHADDAAMEMYFKRGVAFGIFTSMGDKYYTTPAWRHNAQKMHDRYIGLLRMLHEAGWHPVRAVAGAEGVYSERFGASFLTLYNESREGKELVLRPELRVARAVDRVSGEKFAAAEGRLTVRVGAGQLRVLEME